MIHLQATDKTRLSDTSGTHDVHDYWPFCVVNDLLDDLRFPVLSPAK